MSHRALCLAMLCAAAPHALASPRSDPTTGRGVFTGATMPSATSIELNPSALGLGTLDEVYVAALGTLDHYSISRRHLDIDTGAISEGESVRDTLASPGGVAAFIWHPGGGGRFTLGFGLRTAPAERFVAQEPLRYHTLGGSFRSYAGPIPTLAASLRVSNRFYLGVSVVWQSSVLSLRYARDTALEAARDPLRGIASDCDGSPCGIENPLAEERYLVEARSDFFALANVAVNLGVVVRIAREVWLGVAYHAPPGLSVQNELEGDMTVHRAIRDGGDTVEGAATVYLSQPASVDAELRARLVGDLDLHAGARWEYLSRFQAFDVRGYGSFFRTVGIPEWQRRPRGFDQVFAAWAGVEQDRRDFPLSLGARIGFETSALSDARTSPMNVAPLSGTLDAGLQYRVSDPSITPQVVVQATYGIQYFRRVDTSDSAYDPRDLLECYDSDYDYSTAACESVRNGYGIPTAAGEYQRIQQAARIALRFMW